MEVSPPEPDLAERAADQLGVVDSLHEAWRDAMAHLPDEDRSRGRDRRLRRHAIETGIIEQLYDVEWGVTEALVAEGITADVAARAGGLSTNTLEIVRSQLDALEFLTASVTEGRGLSTFFIRQLHEAITKSQRTYTATDTLGRTFEAILHHGQYKTTDNHVRRPDGSLLKYTPYEHVPAQMERLVELDKDVQAEHPIVRAAWLHHRFIRIHPFEDGNGRVARALVLLALLEQHFAPLVVPSEQREGYITSLDAANDGDLLPLVRMFAKLEIVALRSELVAPAAGALPAQPVAIAQELARRVGQRRAAEEDERVRATRELAGTLHSTVQTWLEDQATQLVRPLQGMDAAANAWVDAADPSSERGRWWRRQIIQRARELDFFSNVAEGAWWARLRMGALGQALRFVVVVQQVGHGGTGVLAVTTFAELLQTHEPEASGAEWVALGDASVTLVVAEELEQRWADVAALMEQGLALSVRQFFALLGV